MQISSRQKGFQKPGAQPEIKIRIETDDGQAGSITVFEEEEEVKIKSSMLNMKLYLSDWVQIDAHVHEAVSLITQYIIVRKGQGRFGI